MSNPRTLVTFLLDKSGSMETILDDTIGAFNAYLAGIKGEAIDFTLLQFDSIAIEKTCVGTPVDKVAVLTRDSFKPRGSTPLIDAAYKTIKAVEASLSDDPSRKVIICIQTDGHENSSREHTWEDLNDLIKDKIAAGWQFNFMGASIDAYEQGMKMGLTPDRTMSYAKGHDQAAFAATARATRSFLSGETATTSYLQSEKVAAGDVFDPLLPKAPADMIIGLDMAGKVHMGVDIARGPSQTVKVLKDRRPVVDDIKL